VQDVLHHNEISISLDLVRSLIDAQFPRYVSLPVTPLGVSGSTNRLFRLGDALLVRLPRQPDSGKGINKERDWLPELRGQLPVAIPEIVELGRPALGYPEYWSITRWLEGELALAWQPGEPDGTAQRLLAEQLAAFIQALQAIKVPESAKSDATLRSYRGQPLIEYDKYFHRTLEHCETMSELELDYQTARRVWAEALTLSESVQAADCWYHSDLVAENLLIKNGTLSSVLDFGGLAIGDPTIELHGAWELFGPAARDVFRETLQVEDEQWLRGRAWALAIALGALSYYWDTMPNRRRDRLAMARAVLADAKQD
jgi:aminoglycoside phosphotransferase (APT) family kinase protein